MKEPKYENIRKARELRAHGYSDNDLLAAGYDSVTVSRSFISVTDRNAVKVRCKNCRHLYYRVNRQGVCLACEIETKNVRDRRIAGFKVEREPIVQEIQVSHLYTLQGQPE